MIDLFAPSTLDVDFLTGGYFPVPGSPSCNPGTEYYSVELDWFAPKVGHDISTVLPAVERMGYGILNLRWSVDAIRVHVDISTSPKLHRQNMQVSLYELELTMVGYDSPRTCTRETG